MYILALPYQIGNGKLDSLKNGFKNFPDVIYSVTLCILFCCSTVISHRRDVPREDHISVVVTFFS